MRVVSVYIKQKNSKKVGSQNLNMGLKMALCKQGLRNDPLFTT